VTTGDQPSVSRADEYLSVRPVDLMIDDTLCHLVAGVDEEGGLIIQSQASGRWLEIDLSGIDPAQVQIVRIAQKA
jgi:hypothetical protein